MKDRNLTAEGGAAESALHDAAWRGDLEAVRRFVAAGADVNWKDSIGETVLFGAAAWGHAEVVRYLLSVGARHDFRELHSGYTPLHWAARSNVETLRVLVEAGADPAALDKAGQLPIDVAHKHGKGALVAFLNTVGPRIQSRRTNG